MADDAPLFNGGFSWERTGVYDIATAPFLVRLAAATAARGGGYASDGRRSESDPAALLDGWTILSDFRPGSWRIVCAEDSDGRLAAVRFNGDVSTVDAEVYSPSGHADAHAAVDRILAGAAAVVPPAEGLTITFWTLGPFGPQPFRRTLDAPEWATTGENYAASIRPTLDEMHAWSRFPDGGRLILSAGEPGTGKTTLVKTLARAWRGWCDVEYVVDVDAFFEHAAYMTGVLIGGEDYSSDVPRSRLIVVEDCDELLSVDAKARSGESFSRLLNVCDGLVGQGLRVALYMTTNEPVDTFHPAVMRPGRCLATLHVDALAETEADAWRASHDLAPTGEPASLAALYDEVRKAETARRASAAEEFVASVARMASRATTVLGQRVPAAASSATHVASSTIADAGSPTDD